MKKIMKKIPESGTLVVPFVILLCVLGYVISLRINAQTLGEDIGSGYGYLVGKAIGSFEGLTQGSSEGYKAGKEKGLSAEDTTAEIANSIREVEKLEVLVASVKLNDLHSVGEEDYKALYLLKGDAVFSVDLSKAVIDEKNGELYITIPQPEMELIVDPSRIEKVAEYQKYFFSGKAEDGLDAYINSMKKIVEESEKSLANYDSLLKAAKASAEKQITILAKSVSVNNREVHVYFQEKQNEEGEQ